MALIYLAEIQHSAGTLYYSSKKNVTVSGNAYKAWIKQPAFFGQSIEFSSAFGGAMSATVGEITLGNYERQLDDLRSYVFSGYPLTLFTYDTVSLTKTQVLVRKIEQVTWEWDTISFRLIDETSRLEKPLQTKLFAGNNSLPNGVEGVLDLKNKVKPLIFGRVNNFSPVSANTSKLIYQISSETVQQVVSVFSNGSYVTPSSNTIASFNDFVSDASGKVPEAGTFTFYSGVEGSFIRLAMESGTVTCTAWERTSPIDCTISAIAQRILILAGYTSSDWEADDFTYLDSLQGDSLGLYFDNETTVADALNTLFTGTGCYWGFDGNNKFRAIQFGNFSQASVGTIDNSSASGLSGTLFLDQVSYGLTSFELEKPNYFGKIAPVKSVKIQYDKNWSVIDTASQAGIVVVEQVQRSEWLANEWRSVLQSTTSSSLIAQEIQYDCYFVSEYAAKAEALRILNLTSVDRDIATCTARLPVTLLKALLPGKTVTVKLPRYGLTNGKDYVILSVENDYELLTTNLVLWG